MWSMVSLAFGAHSRPSNFSQYFCWVAKLLPRRTNLHVVLVAALCWALWKLRNRACFDLKLIKNPVEIICYACSFLKYWAGLQLGADKDDILAGANKLQSVASFIQSTSATKSPGGGLIAAGVEGSH